MYRFPSAARKQLKHRTNCRQSWEHSARCVKPAKPEIHATASQRRARQTLPAIVGNTARGASEPVKPEENACHCLVDDVLAKTRIDHRSRDTHHVENHEILPKTHPGNAKHGSTVEPSMAPSHCTNGHSNLVQELDEPKTATAEAPQFSAQPNQSTCRCTATGASTTIPRTVTVRSPRSAVQCALCVPRTACNWKVHHSVEELN